jgi:hypothetical protein
MYFIARARIKETTERSKYGFKFYWF